MKTNKKFTFLLLYSLLFGCFFLETKAQPGLTWATYYGHGHGSETINDILVLSNGNVIIVGYGGSEGNTSPLVSPGAPYTQGNPFIACFNPNGDRLWATRFPVGSGPLREITEIGVGVDNSLYVCGFTDWDQLPTTPGVYQVSHGGSYDAFVAKLNPNNGSIIWLSYYGGVGWDQANGLGIASDGIYICGSGGVNYSGPLPVHKPAPNWLDQEEAFLAKFHPNNGTLIWTTYIGGSGNDKALDVVIGVNGNVYVSGITSSSNNMDTLGQTPPPPAGSNSNFIACFNPSNGQRLWSRYFGESYSFHSNTLEAASNGDLVFFASVSAGHSSLVTPGSFQLTTDANPSNPGSVIARFNPSGMLVWGSYYSGKNTPSKKGLALDSQNNVYITSNYNHVGNLITPGAFNLQSTYGGFYLAKFNFSNGQRIWGTVVGATHGPAGAMAIGVGQGNKVYVGGITPDGFPANTYQTTKSDSSDAFLAQFIEIHVDLSNVPSCAHPGQSINVNIPATTLSNCYNISLSASGLPPGINFIPTANGGQLQGTFSTAGTFTLNIHANNSCGHSGTFKKVIKVGNPPFLPALPNASGTQGNPFTYNVPAATVSTHLQPATYSATNLPAGLTINSTNGQITGTPTVHGNFTANVTVTDACNFIASQPLSINIAPGCFIPNMSMSTSSDTCNSIQITWNPMSICPSSTHISFRYKPSSSSTWITIPVTSRPAVSAGSYTLMSLPPGTYDIQAAVVTGGQNGTVGNYENLPAATITCINSSSLPSCAVVGDNLNASITIATGCQPANLTASGLPPGITFTPSPSGGTLQGTFSSAGTYTIAIQGPSNCGSIVPQLITIKVGSNPTSLPNYPQQYGLVGQAFNYNASGNSDSNFNPTSYSATGLPPGLSINSSTGVISGTPNSANLFNATITLTNTCGSVSSTLPIQIIPNQACPAFSLNPTASALNCTSIKLDWTSASGCTTSHYLAIRYKISSASTWTNLPNASRPAVNANTYTITGLTPNTTYNLQIQVVASQSAAPNNASWIALPNINLPTCPPPPVITGPSTINHCASGTLSVSLQATNSPSSWAHLGGLPTGLTLNTSTGVISGTAAAGTYSATFTATNFSGTSSPYVTIIIVNSSPTITSSNTATTTAGQSFSYTLTATSSLTPTLTITPINPAPGLSINASTLSGTPTTPGTYTYSLNASNSCGTTSQTLTLNVSPAAPPVLPPISNPPSIVQGSPISPITPSAPTVASGCSPVTWSMSGHPTGLTINPSTGQITGTPTQSGNFTVTVTVTDNCGGSASQTFTLNITPATLPTITSPTSSSATMGQLYNYSLTATGTPTPSLTITPLTPAPGLNISGNTISGTPTATGTFTYLLTATNTAGTTTSTLSIAITAPPPSINYFLTQARLRAMHGGFQGDIPLILGGSIPTVDPRRHNVSRELVLIFSPATSNITTISITASDPTILGTPIFSNNNIVRVPVQNLANNTTYTIQLSTVNGTTIGNNNSFSFRIVRGDINNTNSVNAVDVNTIQAHIGQPISNTNFRYDINADGNITSLDVTQAQSNLGGSAP
ncbi:MAG: putative Ig domain-containing protein [Methylacidiphilales bacterium]|nr:putative Ig domain-containing protein [Candidatus Methylacidiphilales bacterium]